MQDGRGAPQPAAATERSILLALPKVELHVHLEGSFTTERISALAAAAGEPLPGPAAGLFNFGDLSSFLALLDWWCGLVRTEEQAEAQAHGFASFLHADGVAYAEVAVNPTHWSGLPRAHLLEAVSAGFERAAHEGLTDCRLVVSLLRRQSAEEAIALVDDLAVSRPGRLVGLGVDGDEAEAGPTGDRFAPAFAAASEIGLGLTAHAGESSGPEGVVSALDDLGATRIDHGVRAIEDSELLRRLAAQGVTLNLCLTSNARLLYGSLEAHPVAAIAGAGVPVTINTDDPVLLGTTLSAELALAAERCGWGLPGSRAATERAIDAAFCSREDAERLRARLAEFHTGLPAAARV